MIIKTRVFELANGKYHNLSDLAMAMELSVSQVYRVREGKRSINHKFIVGAKRAFPSYRLDELFYVDHGTSSGTMVETNVTSRYKHIVAFLELLDKFEVMRCSPDPNRKQAARSGLNTLGGYRIGTVASQDDPIKIEG